MRTTVQLLMVIFLLQMRPLIVSAAQEDGRTQISPNLQDVVLLVESGVEEQTVVAWIENASTPFALTADEIIYLNDIGIAPSIITAMLRHDAALRELDLQTGLLLTNDLPVSALLQTNLLSATNLPPVYVTNAPTEVHYFYESLAPYGTWVQVDTFGWCWRPHAVVLYRDWHPYWHHGRWIYTDSGWYWYSHYSWGWAPFHYGRWHRHHHLGWVWLPDLVWGPAWVSWRFSHGHCGWAPLPPGAHFVIGHGWRFHNVPVDVHYDFGLSPDRFVFVELRHLHERDLHIHRIPPQRAGAIHRTTVVNNNYAVGHDNTVVNRGIPVERVAAASGRDIHPMPVRRTPVDGRQPVERIAQEGSHTVVHRPELARPSARTQVPVAQRIHENETLAPVRRPLTVAPSRIPQPHQTLATPARRPTQERAGPSHGRSSVPPAPSQTPAQRHGADRPAQARPAIPPLVTPRQPPRHESPRGREQRLSNGYRLQPTPPPPTTQSRPSGASPPAPSKPRSESRR